MFKRTRTYVDPLTTLAVLTSCAACQHPVYALLADGTRLCAGHYGATLEAVTDAIRQA